MPLQTSRVNMDLIAWKPAPSRWILRRANRLKGRLQNPPLRASGQCHTSNSVLEPLVGDCR